MRHWKIAEDQVAAIIAEPDATTPGVRGRTNAWKRHGDEWIRVTYIPDGGVIVVVTVTPKRRGPR
jgi:hypothetical protein